MMDIHGTCAVIRKQKPLTSGLVGAKVSFRFDSGWEGLAKTAVFRCGDMTKDVLLESDPISIPAEVLQGGLPLEIGVYGTRGSDLAIPTVWAKTAPVAYGTDPSGDPAADPTLPLWAQLRQQVTDNTEALTRLRENMGSGGTGGGAGKSAYEIAKEQGFEGTVTQWLESLKGEQGPQGEQGEPGADAPADTYLPKDGSEPMAGDLSMEGHRLTGLGAPVSDTDAVRKQDVRLAGWMPTAEEVGARPDTWTPTAEEVGAAPAGYGLGTTAIYKVITTSSELDAFINNGWYAIDCANKLTVNGISFQHFTMLVSSYNQDHTHQELWVCGSDFHLCRDKKARVWSEWEWENPPMFIGVEYRTAERYNGSPVYTKVLDFGNLPNASTKSMNCGVHASNMLSMTLRAVDGTEMFNEIGGAAYVGTIFMWESTICVRTTNDQSRFHGYITIKYIK